jgi:hypothetical protein
MQTAAIDLARRLILGTLVLLGGLVFEASVAAQEAIPWNERPQRIRVLLVSDAAPEWTGERIADLGRQLQALAATHLGRLWQIEVATAPASLRQSLLNASPWAEPRDVTTGLDGVDQLCIVTLRRQPNGYSIVSRGWSTIAQRWTAPALRTAPRTEDVVAAMFRAVHATSGFVARIVRLDGDTVVLQPRGARLGVGRRESTTCRVGAVLQIVPAKPGTGSAIDDAFLVVRDRGVLEATALWQGREASRASLPEGRLQDFLALEVPATGLATTVRFRVGAADGPAAQGLEAYVQPSGGGAVDRLGLLDADGMVVLPTSAAPLSQLILGQNGKPLARFSLIPGQVAERTIVLPESSGE